MRVWLLISELGLGGAERQLVLLADGLSRHGHDVSIVEYRGRGPLGDVAESIGLDVVTLNQASTLGAILAVRRQIRSKRGVVYAFLPAPSIVATLASVGFRSVRVAWGVRASNVDLSMYGARSKRVWQLSRVLSRCADVIISNSNRGAQYHVQALYPAHKIRVIPNGIEVSRFRPDPSLRASQRARWRVSESTVVVGMLARFDPIKGHHDFVRACQVAMTQVPDLFIALKGGGDSSLRRRIEAQCLELFSPGKFAIEEPDEDPVEFLNGLDLLVISSQSEGFPNVAVEAMACGTLVVGYEVGDLSDIVMSPEHLAPPGSPELLG